jgi:hypothetical protein
MNGSSYSPPPWASLFVAWEPLEQSLALCLPAYGTGSVQPKAKTLRAKTPKFDKKRGCLAMRALFLFPLVFAHSVSAQATIYFQTGNELFALCNDRDPQQKAFCMGTASGYSDMLQAMRETCADKNVSQGQVSDIVVKFLRIHPELRNLGAASLARAALKEAFPCPQK